MAEYEQLTLGLERSKSPGDPESIKRRLGRTGLRLVFASGVLTLFGSGAAGCNGVLGAWVEQSAMKECAYSGYHGDEPDGEFAESCQDAYFTNHDGLADNDDEIYETDFAEENDRYVAAGVVGALSAAGLMVVSSGLRHRFYPEDYPEEFAPTAFEATAS